MASQMSSGQNYWAENQITNHLHLHSFFSYVQGQRCKAMGMMTHVKIAFFPSLVIRGELRMKSPHSPESWAIFIACNWEENIFIVTNADRIIWVNIEIASSWHHHQLLHFLMAGARFSFRFSMCQTFPCCDFSDRTRQDAHENLATAIHNEARYVTYTKKLLILY